VSCPVVFFFKKKTKVNMNEAIEEGGGGEGEDKLEETVWLPSKDC
jgi:hypothetical protein